MSTQQNQPPKPVAPLSEAEANKLKQDPSYNKTTKVVKTESGELRKVGLLKG